MSNSMWPKNEYTREINLNESLRDVFNRAYGAAEESSSWADYEKGGQVRNRCWRKVESKNAGEKKYSEERSIFENPVRKRTVDVGEKKAERVVEKKRSEEKEVVEEKKKEDTEEKKVAKKKSRRRVRKKKIVGEKVFDSNGITVVKNKKSGLWELSSVRGGCLLLTEACYKMIVDGGKSFEEVLRANGNGKLLLPVGKYNVVVNPDGNDGLVLVYNMDEPNRIEAVFRRGEKDIKNYKFLLKFNKNINLETYEEIISYFKSIGENNKSVKVKSDAYINLAIISFLEEEVSMGSSGMEYLIKANKLLSEGIIDSKKVCHNTYTPFRPILLIVQVLEFISETGWGFIRTLQMQFLNIWEKKLDELASLVDYGKGNLYAEFEEGSQLYYKMRTIRKELQKATNLKECMDIIEPVVYLGQKDAQSVLLIFKLVDAYWRKSFPELYNDSYMKSLLGCDSVQAKMLLCVCSDMGLINRSKTIKEMEQELKGESGIGIAHNFYAIESRLRDMINFDFMDMSSMKFIKVLEDSLYSYLMKLGFKEATYYYSAIKYVFDDNITSPIEDKQRMIRILEGSLKYEMDKKDQGQYSIAKVSDIRRMIRDFYVCADDPVLGLYYAYKSWREFYFPKEGSPYLYETMRKTLDKGIYIFSILFKDSEVGRSVNDTFVRYFYADILYQGCGGEDKDAEYVKDVVSIFEAGEKLMNEMLSSTRLNEKEYSRKLFVLIICQVIPRLFNMTTIAKRDLYEIRNLLSHCETMNILREEKLTALYLRCLTYLEEFSGEKDDSAEIGSLVKSASIEIEDGGGDHLEENLLLRLLVQQKMKGKDEARYKGRSEVKEALKVSKYDVNVTKLRPYQKTCSDLLIDVSAKEKVKLKIKGSVTASQIIQCICTSRQEGLFGKGKGSIEYYIVKFMQNISEKGWIELSDVVLIDEKDFGKNIYQTIVLGATLMNGVIDDKKLRYKMIRYLDSFQRNDVASKFMNLSALLEQLNQIAGLEEHRWRLAILSLAVNKLYYQMRIPYSVEAYAHAVYAVIRSNTVSMTANSVLDVKDPLFDKKIENFLSIMSSAKSHLRNDYLRLLELSKMGECEMDSISISNSGVIHMRYSLAHLKSEGALGLELFILGYVSRCKSVCLVEKNECVSRGFKTEYYKSSENQLAMILKNNMKIVVEYIDLIKSSYENDRYDFEKGFANTMVKSTDDKSHIAYCQIIIKVISDINHALDLKNRLGKLRDYVFKGKEKYSVKWRSLALYALIEFELFCTSYSTSIQEKKVFELLKEFEKEEYDSTQGKLYSANIKYYLNNVRKMRRALEDERNQIDSLLEENSEEKEEKK